MDKKFIKVTRAKRAPCRRRARRSYVAHMYVDPDLSDEDFASLLINRASSDQRRARSSRRSNSRHSCGHACTAKKKAAPKPRKSGIQIELSDSDDEQQNANPTSNLVKDRVSQFFKDNNLLSDDEDVIPVEKKNVDSSKPSTVVKKYTLSDSDDETKGSRVADSSGASTSGYSMFVPQVMTDEEFYGLPSANLKSDTPQTSSNTTSKKDDDKSDDIMAYVDAILVDGLDGSTTKAGDPLADARSFEKFRQETEDMLKNVSNMLDTFKGVKPKEPETPKEPPPPPPPKEDSPKSNLGNCPVCLEPMMKNISSTNCGHIFCKPCITKVAKTHRKCPTCRKGITIKTIHPLFIGV